MTFSWPLGRMQWISVKVPPLSMEKWNLPSPFVDVNVVMFIDGLVLGFEFVFVFRFGFELGFELGFVLVGLLFFR